MFSSYVLYSRIAQNLTQEIALQRQKLARDSQEYLVHPRPARKSLSTRNENIKTGIKYYY